MRSRIIAMLLFAFSIFALASNPTLAALTPAGTQIKNTATANYSDVNSNPKGEVKSNEVVTTVSTLRGVDITPNPDPITGVSYSAGTTDDKVTEYAFTITNTGNAEDTIDLALAGQNASEGWTYELFKDENGNGQLDVTEVRLRPADTGVLQQGGTFKAIVRVSAPPLPGYNKSDGVTLTATSEDGVTKDTGMITLNLSSPVVSISKEVKYYSGPIGMPGGIYSYLITVRNSDMESPAHNVQVFDGIDGNLEMSGIQYDTGISTVVQGRDYVEWTIPRLAPNSATTLRILVKVRETAREGSKIYNQADMSYEDFNSNTYGMTADSSAVTVLFKAGLEIESLTPRTTEGYSGGQVIILFDLVNTGNGMDSIFLASSTTEWMTSESIVTTTWQFTYDWRNFEAGERRRVIAQTIIPADALDYYGGALEILAESIRGATDTISYGILALTPILTMEKIVDKESARPGDTLTYMFRIQNLGHAPAASAVLVDAIPDNTTYVAGSIRINNVAQTDEKDADQADFNISNTGAVTVNMPLIAPRALVTIMFRVTVD